MGINISKENISQQTEESYKKSSKLELFKQLKLAKSPEEVKDIMKKIKESE